MIARVLRGGECETPDIVLREVNPSWALAMSKGYDSPVTKDDPNEDAAGVVAGGLGVVAIVADGHFGRLSAELTVNHLLNMALQEPPPRAKASEVWDWLEEHLHTANRRVLAHDGRSATALVAGVLQGRAFRWVSLGDCRLYHVTATGQTILNPLNGIYLGDHLEIVLNVGEAAMAPGDRIVLASDGLPECRYGKRTLTPAQVGRGVRDRSVSDAAKALVQLALDHGGEDNIAVVVGEV